MSPEKMLLWHQDYFELKALEKQQVREGCCFFLKAGDKTPVWKMPFLHQKERSILLTGDESGGGETCTNRPRGGNSDFPSVPVCFILRSGLASLNLADRH